MKFKIGDRIIDDNEQPIMVILSDEDKKNIASMLPEAHKYCSFPDGVSEEEIRKWMAEE